MISDLFLDLFNSTPNNGLLERWRENIIAFLNSRTGDKTVISSLGDKLWSTQRRIEAAHFWYVENS